MTLPPVVSFARWLIPDRAFATFGETLGDYWATLSGRDVLEGEEVG